MSASTPMEATNGFHRHLNGAAAVPVQVDNNNGISAVRDRYNVGHFHNTNL